MTPDALAIPIVKRVKSSELPRVSGTLGARAREFRILSALQFLPSHSMCVSTKVAADQGDDCDVLRCG